MKIEDIYKSAKIGIGVLVLTAMSLLPSCGKPNEKVRVACAPGGIITDSKGSVSFGYKGKRFVDFGYDGTLDEVIQNIDGKMVGTKDPKELQKFNKFYLEAREKATNGE